MIEIILAFIGCVAVLLLGLVIAFFGGLGDDRTVFFVGIGTFFVGVFVSAYQISKVFIN